jgi:Fe-S-cluster containining protein
MQEFIERTRAIFGAMQGLYDSVAGHYGFGCEGCKDNCCIQRFFHHPYAEYYFLLEGMRQTEPGLVAEMLTRARVVTDSYMRELQAGEILPLMCPVNFDGRCALYEYRPMICRMHGLPHRFRMPNGQEQLGGGCNRFEELHEAGERLDRTVVYTELAMIERDLRAAHGLGGRLKKTTAEMLMDMPGHLDIGNEED